MIGLILILATVGLLLSAFFSGSETGFYRVARVRLVLDALGGDLVARSLVWIANRPSLFVATSLVGNNLANYLVSLAIVMGSQAIFGPDCVVAELVGSLLLAPVLFVYGELLPKNLFLHAPNRLLRLGGPLFSLFLVLFFPVSLLLWGLNHVLARLLGQSPEQVRLALARRELQRILDEGQEAGILHPAQQRLARGIFALAAEPVLRLAAPLAEVPRGQSNQDRNAILTLAKRHQMPDLPIQDAAHASELVGYIRAVELQLAAGEPGAVLRPLVDIAPTDTYIAALVRLENAGQTMGRVLDAQGRTLGVLTAERLRQSLFHERRPG